MFSTFPKCNIRTNNGAGLCIGVLVPCSVSEHYHYTSWVCTGCGRTVDYEGCHKPVTEDKNEPKS